MQRILILVLAVSLLPAPVLACGGFFCNGGTLVAVDQKKERILFEVNGDGTLTTTVEVSYEGSPSAFSWVVPISDVPTLDVVAPSALRLLDTVTSPRLIPPDIEWPQDRYFNQFDGDDDDDDLAADDDDATGEPVDVVDLPVVGPFDPEVVSSEDPAALIAWLNENGYLITAEMEPFIADYVAAGLSFLCMKLTPESGVEDIAPIQMTYPGTQPTIPLRLTAVAAEPDMQVLAFIAAGARYEPENVPAIPIDKDFLRADPRNGDNNYYPLLSYQLDLAGGQGFATEFADGMEGVAEDAQWSGLNTSDEAEARLYVAELAERQPYLTRLLTRINPEEMTVDPSFAPMASSTPVSNVHDLRDQPPVWHDLETNPPAACNDLYCGEAGLCATDASEREGCACEADSLARLTDKPNVASTGSDRQVTCVDAEFNLMPSVFDEGPSPCEDWTCGDGGSCVVLNGSPTCACAEGGMAVKIGDTIECVEAITTYDPALALLWEEPASSSNFAGASCEGGSCSSTAGSAGSTGAALLGLLILGLMRRRTAS